MHCLTGLNHFGRIRILNEGLVSQKIHIALTSDIEIMTSFALNSATGNFH